jgi:mannose-1-phosphate guanylyltransferase
MLVVPADLGWSDIGSWAAVFDIMAKKDGANVTDGEVLTIDTENCLIHGADRLIATVGLKNVVVVDTGDVILIAEKGDSQRVKEVIEQLRVKGEKKYL